MSQSSVTTASNGSESDPPASISSPTSPYPDEPLDLQSAFTNQMSINWFEAGNYLHNMMDMSKWSDSPLSRKAYAMKVMEHVEIATALDLAIRWSLPSERSGTREQLEEELSARLKRSAPPSETQRKERLTSVQKLSETLKGLQVELAGGAKNPATETLPEETTGSLNHVQSFLKNIMSSVLDLEPIREALLEEIGSFVDRVLPWSEQQQASVTAAFRDQTELLELVTLIVERYAEMEHGQLSQQFWQQSQNEPTQSSATMSRGFSFRSLKQRLSDGLKEMVAPKSGNIDESTRNLTR